MENTSERSLKKIREQNSPTVLSELLDQSHRETLDDTEQDASSSLSSKEDREKANNEAGAKIKELVRQLSDGPKTPIRAADGHNERLSDPSLIRSDDLKDRSSLLTPNSLRSGKAEIEAPDRIKRVLSDDLPILLEVRDLSKGYIKAKKLIPVLQGISIQIKQGEFLVIVGQSGSGKSTLLHLMGTLDRPDAGTIHFDGQRTDNLPASQRDFIRNRYIGMIFQFYHLIPEMTTLENVIAPLMIRDSILGYFRNRRLYYKQATDLLNQVGLSHRLKHRPNELSGGEMQRASIARALITDPRVLLADEPTGNLDSKTSLGIIRLLQDLNREKGLTIIMVTHDMSQTEGTDRTIRLIDGQIAN